MKALIIEDEALSRAHMAKLLAAHFPQVEVAGTAGSVKDSLAWLASNPSPDVIFMDVELSDGSSFEIFTRTRVSAPVVMTTAYDQYAVQAFRVHAVDYLLKPVEVSEMQRAIARVEAGEGSRPGPDLVREMLSDDAAGWKEKFLIRLNDRVVPVRTADVAYFYSSAKSSYLVTLSGTSYVVDDSLDTIAESLDPAAFFRISRSCIISESVIDSASRLIGGRLRITLRPGFPTLTDLSVSRARTEDFLSWLSR